ncbi:hypothetical protein F0562_019958 [Nyssa sinensis]|uniref:DNA 3'-5' helicase n=1 Tax=Nyssa sinensis TaxID=561372 RepID=A0A5J5BPS6_9ASTE|nr:hypothetical protein F0562_019958 [Nyssa sinensis]
MGGSSLSSDQVIAELIGMGFEFSDVTEAIKAVGPSLEDAVDFILNGSHRNNKCASGSSKCSTNNEKALGKRVLSSSGFSGRMRQSTIMDHLKSADRPKRSRTNVESNVLVSVSEALPNLVRGPNQPLPGMDYNLKATPETSIQPSVSKRKLLPAWLAHQDCLVLAATGSGKSLCFQIPALLTGKVVVVVSPLISLMHDQCLKLAKHGVSACFLGSGQTDSSVEQKAMRGMYGIIYVCPETILRLIKPLQSLAESRGIALFAIDEVHCVSKWGHDFRPDYRRLSVLRENFRADNLKFLKFDIPLMALTATATIRVRDDILESLCMSKESRIVLTSFFRPNLRFSVKHSRTSSPSSYEKDFRELIDINTRKKKVMWTILRMVPLLKIMIKFAQAKENGSTASKEKKMSVEYLEDECDLFQDVNDLDVPCGEFYGQSSAKDWDVCGASETFDLRNSQNKPEERLKLLQGPLEQGLTIIYVPTRKETLNIAKFLCQFGVRAAAYNAKLPKSHLRQVHKEFHENALEVVVATIAFGMGIDKLNVRRIIHYGWPQSLEAYYQEAGRAGRDGKLADCVLYANLSRIPTLLPSQRSEDQTKQAYKMLSDCFRYGMGTSSCRAKTLVEYFGEHFSYEKCLLCDVCVKGPPEMQNLKAEADIFMQVIAAHYGQNSFSDISYDNVGNGNKQGRFMEKPNLKELVSKIREQCQKYAGNRSAMVARSCSYFRRKRVHQRRRKDDPCSDKISRANRIGIGIFAVPGAILLCIPRSRYGALNGKMQIFFHILRMGKRLG